jgi:aconitate hydratase
VLRQHAEGRSDGADIAAVAGWLATRRAEREIAFRFTRVLMPDSSGVPLLGDLAAMRDALIRLGGEPTRLNPSVPVDLVVDHSVMVDVHGTADAAARNQALELQRNAERYAFLRWGAQAFSNLRIVPPGNGILHQINLEYLARVVWTADGVAYPDSVLGMDSHTAMINSLGILGWGVGGLEGGAGALGESVAMLVPEVIGCRLVGKLRPGVTATDLVLTVTQRLRRHKVVDKFVEYFGPGVAELALPDRATVANMSPENGATMGFFPVDAETLRYLRLTGRDEAQVALVDAYCRAQGLWRDAGTPAPEFSEVIEIDLSAVEPSVSGPSRPQDRVPLAQAPAAFRKAIGKEKVGKTLKDGDVVIAAITSCTNTSNPSVMLGAGLLARNAVARGLKPRPWVKTSLSPGSRVVADYLAKSGLQDSLDALGFQLAGFGCMTCMGNSGPLPPAAAQAIQADGVTAVAVLSGNRNFEGRIHPAVRANFLASPPLVVAYALAGSVLVDLAAEPLGEDREGRSSCATCGPTARSSTASPRRCSARRSTANAMPASPRARRNGARSPAERARRFPGTRQAPSSAGRLSSRTCRPSQWRPATSAARACSACSATCSPPTISRRSARSRRARPPPTTSPRSASRRAISSTTPRGA